MNRKLEISIGIAAYNEEKNIKNVIEGILSQVEKGWKFKELIVLSDGSTDKTVQKARGIKNNYVKVIEDRKRRGKTQRLRQLFRIFKGEVLVMFDGDITFSNKNVISELIKPFLRDNKTMLVGGNSMPFEPKTFVEKAVYATFSVFYESRKKINGGNNVFGATGSILAIRRSLADKIDLPPIVNEDAYLYLDCIRKGFDFKYVDNAVIYYQLPTTFSDYIKQVFRSNPESVTIELERYFGFLVHKEFDRPKGFYARNVFVAFKKNPFGVLSIIVINLLCRPLHKIIMKNYKYDWFTAVSTK